MLLLNPGKPELKPKSAYGNMEPEWLTERQWYEKGFKPIVGMGGSILWTNRYCSQSSLYYHESQVTPMTSKEIREYQDEKRETKNRKARERYYETVIAPRERQKKRLETWKPCRDLVSGMVFDIDPDLKIVLDTETTGLDSSEDEVLELAIVRLDTGDVLFNQRFSTKWNDSWYEASKINGIRPDDVQDLPWIDASVVDIARIIGSASVVVGYNLYFDLGMLRKYGIKPHEEAVKRDCMYEFAEFYGEWLSWADDYKWQKLTTAAWYVGYRWDQPAHGALADCLATRAVYGFLNPVSGRRRTKVGKRMRFGEKYEGRNWDLNELADMIGEMFNLVEGYISERLDCDFLGLEVPKAPDNLTRWITRIEDAIKLYLDYMMDDKNDESLPPIEPVKKQNPKIHEWSIQRFVSLMVDQEKAIEKREEEIVMKCSHPEISQEIPNEQLENDIMTCLEGKEYFDDRASEIANRIIKFKTAQVLNWIG